MKIEEYYNELGRLPLLTSVTNGDGSVTTLSKAFHTMSGNLRARHEDGHICYLIGNGGSAAMASHMAEDYTKNGGIRSMTFNDAPMLTCFANDLGYENIFTKSIEFFAKQGDSLIAISSSGNSPNIIKACEVAKKKKLNIYTFSGFQPDNKLRKLGKLNFYVPATEYGFVECTHNALLHGMLDLYLGGIK